MMKNSVSRVTELFCSLVSFMRICMFRILSVGPIPNHIAFIMDGNRRYAKKENMKEGAGHRAGFSALISILKYCYELGVKYVTVYAFSIDNFKRRPDEVQDLMDLMLEKIEELLKEESIVNQYGIRVYFIGNLTLLNEPVRIAAEKVMRATANNTKCTFLICIAYTSCDEIVHAVQESCKFKRQEFQPLTFSQHSNDGIGFQETQKDEFDKSQEIKASKTSNGLTRVEGGGNKISMAVPAAQGLCENKWDKDQTLTKNKTENGVLPSEESEKMQGACSLIKLVDIERNMYMAVAPEPDILIRSSGETRLSNFLLWQASDCMLYSPDALWPEIGFQHLVWVVINFQRNYSYLEKKRKQL
ncbi:dehydrodolichyl diphosphate synthase CPT3 [Ricinus communis]|uniref:dehydrodolichyl diphosphate synthase CPT3 n=1 Tax=Ricinus communis TaxID=3988 RepID=UPI000772389C|nr:dehydrodolichyl diphosphate synthase CPT3 [Ricinus communis]|eukprot:XP_015576325.1 dehydrodolichyl diphosphate synthase 6 [Ricinus communis]